MRAFNGISYCVLDQQAAQSAGFGSNAHADDAQDAAAAWQDGQRHGAGAGL
jgi:hypothetical protein